LSPALLKFLIYCTDFLRSCT